MGSRRVLGNDPFQRGAAERPPVTPPTTAGMPPEQPVPPERTGGAPVRTEAAPGPRPGKKRTGARTASVPATPTAGADRPPARSTAHERPMATAQTLSPAADVASVRKSRPDEDATTPVAPEMAVPLAASVIPEPPPAAPSGPPPPERVSRAAKATEAPGEALPEAFFAPPPAPGSASTLSWTPLPDTTSPAPERTPSPPAVKTVEGGGTLGEVLRVAPGLLAEAWSALEAAIRALRAGLGTGGGEQLDVYGRDTRLSEAVAPLVDFLYSRWFRVEVEGATHVPAGGALLVANHAGALPLDGPMLHEALRRERPDLPESRWLAEDQVFYAPLLGTLFNRLGAVRASPDSATRLLAEGRPVLIFPEGIQGIGKPFRERYRLQRFGRGGFVKLALRTHRPILPVAIMGAEETLPLLGKLPGGLLGVPYVPVTPVPLPAKWRIRIGEPIAVPAGATETDLTVVESLVDATRNTIEHMLRELLGARSGVFLG